MLKNILRNDFIRTCAYCALKIIGFLLGPYHQKNIRSYLKGSESAKKLHLGCGSNRLKGWLNTDLKLEKGIVYLDASSRLPFKDAQFDYVFTEHMLEHLDYRQGLSLLRECHRVLKSGGKIRVATPNLKFLADLYQQESKSDLQLRYLQWAGQSFVPEAKECLDVHVINNFFRAWGHRFIYDSKTLQSALKDSGFVQMSLPAVGESQDSHLKGLESHGRRIGDEFNRLETIVVEAVKT